MTLRDSLSDCLVNPSAPAFEPERIEHFVGELLIRPQPPIGLNPVYQGEQLAGTIFIDVGPCRDARPWTPRICEASGSDTEGTIRAIFAEAAGVRIGAPLLRYPSDQRGQLPPR